MEKSRLKLIALMAIFIGPLIAAFIWYYIVGSDSAPDHRVNNASLITPARPLQDFSAIKPGGEPFKLSDIRQYWHLTHILKNGCDEDCQKMLYNTRQVRLALGKDAHRVKRVAMIDSSIDQEWMAKEHPDLQLVVLDSNAYFEQLEKIRVEYNMQPTDVIVSDPLANAMMFYNLELEPRFFLKDIKKLLKLSRIG